LPELQGAAADHPSEQFQFVSGFIVVVVIPASRVVVGLKIVVVVVVVAVKIMQPA
jgi:hypothetical protein